MLLDNKEDYITNVKILHLHLMKIILEVWLPKILTIGQNH